MVPWFGDGRVGPVVSAIRFNGVAIRNVIGKDWQPAFAVLSHMV